MLEKISEINNVDSFEAWLEYEVEHLKDDIAIEQQIIDIARKAFTKGRQKERERNSVIVEWVPVRK